MNNEELLQSDINFYQSLIKISEIRIEKYKKRLELEPDNRFYIAKIKKEQSNIKRKEYKIKRAMDMLKNSPD